MLGQILVGYATIDLKLVQYLPVSFVQVHRNPQNASSWPNLNDICASRGKCWAAIPWAHAGDNVSLWETLSGIARPSRD